jgi:hypothetical protein
MYIVKRGGKPYVFHKILDLIGKPSLAEHKIYKSQHYDLIKKKKKKTVPHGMHATF